jgi:hypothetical protein
MSRNKGRGSSVSKVSKHPRVFATSVGNPSLGSNLPQADIKYVSSISPLIFPDPSHVCNTELIPSSSTTADSALKSFTWTPNPRLVQIESFRISLTLSGIYDLKRCTSCVCSGRAEEMAAIYCYRNELRGRESYGMGIEG